MIGNIIGNYKIVAKLGEGGMGAVYKGVDMMLEREVAIKALRPELASQTQVVERFRSEAVTLAKLNHPNIATLYSFFRQGDEFYMVLEFVRGVTLDNIIGQRGALPVEQAVPLFSKVLDGIDHAHEMGIIHRDIKPANMMLTDKGALKVLDFGIARILGTSRMTKAGHLIGTIEYMPPEQVKGLETDARSDIYSLGMLLYEMLTGRAAFNIENEFELMSAQINLMPTPPRELNPNIPVEVEQAIMRAIAKNPNERFQTAGDFRTVLLSAGLPTSGKLSPYTAGLNDAKATASLSQPSFNTTPMASVPPTPSFSRDELKETRIGPNPLAKPAAVDSHQLKETRLGVVSAPADPGGAANSHPGIAPPVAAAYQPASHTIPQAQAAPTQQTSFFSKLTPLHYVGAGLAAVVVFGLLISVGAILLVGAKKHPASTPVATKPAAEAPAAPAPSVEQQPTPTTQRADTQPNTPSGSNIVPTVSESPVKPEVAPLQTGALPAPGRPAAKPPAPARPKNNDAAAEARRRREAALKALDQ
jgi:serine/threonine protein kinase